MRVILPIKKLIKETLDEAQKHIITGFHLILRSDQGWQYQIPSYQAQLKKMGIIQSMSRKGNCHDNAPVESFFSLLKRECLNQYNIQNLTELRGILKSYIKWFNNEPYLNRNKRLEPCRIQESSLSSIN